VLDKLPGGLYHVFAGGLVAPLNQAAGIFFI
jgi:hypothetical protein